jgi:hypothetical protein
VSVRPELKRENLQGVKNEIDLSSSLDFNYPPQPQQDFPSFFNSEQIEKEVKEYQQSVAAGNDFRGSQI